jgi:dephospho-CoA kinase
MTVVALTGGIAVGKTAMMEYWQSNFSIPIFDTDDVGRQLLTEAEILTEVKNIFGESVIVGGQIDRVAVQRRIFAHPSEKIALESLLHPHIRERSQALIAQYLKSNPYCIVVVPLLYETDTAANYDRVCVVESALDQRVRRCFDRGLSEKVTLAIMQSQASSEQRLSIAHDVLYNVQDFSFFYEQIDELHASYSELDPLHN